MAAPLHFWSLEETARRIRGRKVSAVEVTEAVLARVRDFNPRLNCFITVMEDEAMAAARRADRALARGELAGPLLGVPVSVKDLFDTRNVRTTAASRIMATRVPKHDAVAVRCLRESGAIIFAKANMSEFAYGSVQSASGELRNPWDTERFAGGSSSGSGSSIAAGLGYASLGSDTAGSIRMPAAFCGVVGLKPTYERVSRAGAVPLAWTMDHAGPLARTVRDAAIVLGALVKRSNGRRPENFLRGLPRNLEGYSIGIPRAHFYEDLDGEVAKALVEAQRVLRRAGARLRTVDIPHAPYANLAAALIMQVEAAAFHRKMISTRFLEYGEIFRGRLVQGLLVPGPTYLKAQQVRALVKLEFDRALEKVDALLTPTTPIPAHRLDETPRKSPRVAEVGRFTSPVNLAGLPALSVPCGFTRGNLPIGMQLVGRAFDESTLIGIGNVYQGETDWHTLHPDND